MHCMRPSPCAPRSDLGENATQLNIQASLSMIARHLKAPRPAQAQALVSLAIGASSAVLKLGEARDVLEAPQPATSSRTACMRRQPLVPVREGRWILPGLTLLVCSPAYAAAKVAMAYVCESSLWNVSGCVPP